jgi:hypothetical protein
LQNFFKKYSQTRRRQMKYHFLPQAAGAAVSAYRGTTFLFTFQLTMAEKFSGAARRNPRSECGLARSWVFTDIATP